MRIPELGLRVRIFLFFAFLMIASVLVISSALYMAHQSTSEQLPRLLATYTGVAAVIIVLILILVWQLFDRHVASALQSLARQMQTAMHADILDNQTGLRDREPYQYLGPVSDAADELISAYQALKSAQLTQTHQNNTNSVQTRQLAAILRDLDVGILVMNSRHEILLYNQCAFNVIERPECLGLARSALQLFDAQALLAGTGELFDQHPGQARKTHVKLKLMNDVRDLTGTLRLIVNEDDQPTGYVFMFDEPWYSVPIHAPPSQHEPVFAKEPAGFGSNRVQPLRAEFYDLDLFDREISADRENCVLKSLDFVVFDTETTGLSPSGGDQIISIAAVRIVNGRVLNGECFDELVHPGMPVPASSIVFHGITDEMLEGRRGIREVLPQFAQFAGNSVLVAHNAAFDMKFIELQSPHCGVKLDNPVLDTVLLSAFVHDHSHQHTLDDLADRYGITIQGRHSALGDALATAQVFVKLVEQLAGRNINTLGEAIKVSNRMTHIKRHQNAY